MKVSTSNIHQLFLELLQETGLLLMPILGVGMLAGIISNYLQVGFLFSTEVIKPKLEKLDPIKGFKRIYSIRALVELLKSILKLVLLVLQHLSLYGCTLTKSCGSPTHCRGNPSFRGKYDLDYGVICSRCSSDLSRA